ncbi:hypothetical protein V8C42DRAFT_357475 [Trichoderma barbatum]
MSWTKRSQEILYRDFTEKASSESRGIAEEPWSLEVWDVSEDGKLREYVQNTVRRLTGRPQLRIVFAPSDVPRQETKGLMIELFHKFGIPHDFTAERARSTSHSFSRRSDENNGFSSWFRFSCISATLAGTGDESPDGEDDAAEEVPLADKFSEEETAFFLQAPTDTNITLGLHEEVEDTAQRVEEEFGRLERFIVRLAGIEHVSPSRRAPLVELYWFARHATELSRALESAIMINESILMDTSISIPSKTAYVAHSSSSSRNTNDNRRPLVNLQLKECLEYRRTLFRSTQLKLSNLQKRIEAATALASNMASQQQSAAVVQGPVSMKLIAASILIFLPTITVATIAGSRLLLTEQLDEEGSWDISATPLFYLLWYISVPLTLAVVFLSLCWLWWRQGKSGKLPQPSSWFQKAMVWRRMKGKKRDNEASAEPV